MAALLHDIGHFPYSHSFETVARSKYPEITHEDYSKAIIQYSEIADRLATVNIDPNKVVEFLNGNYLDHPEFAFLNSLLDSELDIDRLDFLLRDSHYCGVTYGTYDLDRLLLSMKPYNNEVVITSKGIQSAEYVDLCRLDAF